MKKAILSLLLAMCSAMWSATSFAAVINFDDLPGDEVDVIANGYQGFDWVNFGALASSAYPGSGFEAGTVSPSNAAYNRYGDAASVSKSGGAAFDFVGAYFTSSWFEQEIVFEGLRNGQVLYASASTYVLDTMTPQWIELGWAGIDTLNIYNSAPIAARRPFPKSSRSHRAAGRLASRATVRSCSRSATRQSW